MPPIQQLFTLALVVATVSRTVTQEEVFREWKDFCVARKNNGNICKRKFFYLFTCQYCFSHWVTALLLFITRFHFLFADWRGYVMAEFSLVAIANLYMATYERLTVSTKEARHRMEQPRREAKARFQMRPLEFSSK